MTRRAIFLDRDGTLVHPRHYPARPEDLEIYEGVGDRLRLLAGAGFRLVVITNQSGIARGYFTAADLHLMHDHLRGELAREGVVIDGFYHCPHHVDGVVPELAIECECRKPQPGLILQAAHDLTIDASKSWMLGDILDDVQAGNRARCRTVLVDLGTEGAPDEPERRPDFVARDTLHALDIVAAIEGLSPEVDLRYVPDSWAAPAISGRR